MKITNGFHLAESTQQKAVALATEPEMGPIELMVEFECDMIDERVLVARLIERHAHKA